MKIWLDDIRPAPEGWIWSKDSSDFYSIVGAIYNGVVWKISLDHDLGEDSLTGYDLLCEIEKMVAKNPNISLPEFHIHSANPVGRKNMERAIESIKRLTL